MTMGALGSSLLVNLNAGMPPSPSITCKSCMLSIWHGTTHINKQASKTQKENERERKNLAGVEAFALLLHRREGASRAEAHGPVEFAISILPSQPCLHLA